jgi:type IV pilus assembly protein PilX
MKNNNHVYQLSRRQSGVVLVTALIFLVILTIIVLSVMRGGILEERMASNTRNRQLALQAAEAVLRDASVNLFVATPFDPSDLSAFTAACTNGYCDKPAAGSTPRWQTMTAADWTNAAKTRTFAAASSNLAGLSAQPRYIVEFMGYSGGQAGGICPKILYQVTARGVGQDNSVALIQTMYRLQPSSCPWW